MRSALAAVGVAVVVGGCAAVPTSTPAAPPAPGHSTLTRTPSQPRGWPAAASHGAGRSSLNTSAQRQHQTLVPFVRDTDAFNRNYTATGRLVVHYFGGYHTVPPPSTVQSSWENAIATVFVRGETPLGQLGFSFGFTDQDRARFQQLILFVPASRDSGHPSDGYINMPLRTPLPWISAPMESTLSSPTQDGTWVVALRWQDARTLLVTITTAPGHSAPRYLDHGTLQVHASGPKGNEWSQLAVALETHASSADVHGSLTLTPTGS